MTIPHHGPLTTAHLFQLWLRCCELVAQAESKGDQLGAACWQREAAYWLRRALARLGMQLAFAGFLAGILILAL